MFPILYLQMDKRKDPSSVDVKQVLLEMRKYRMGLIQTADQLRFSYLAVIEGAKFIMGDASVQVSTDCRARCGELQLFNCSRKKKKTNLPVVLLCDSTVHAFQHCYWGVDWVRQLSFI